MQKEDNDIFDLRMREILDSGVEKPSEGLWDAIDGHLSAIEAASRKRSAMLFFRRAAIPVAAAAAVALGVFLNRGTDDKLTPDPALLSISAADPAGQTEDGDGQLPELIAMAEPMAEADVETAVMAAAVRMPATAVPMVAPAEEQLETAPSGPVNKADADGTDVEDDAVQEPAGAPNANAGVSNGKNTGNAADNSTRNVHSTDPFAELELAEMTARNRHRARISIGAFADAASNAMAASVAGGPVKYMSQSVFKSADIPTRSTIKETGQSRYAIPVTFGLDARLSLSRHLSMSAGVSFAQLKRSFAGSFTDVSAEDGSIISKSAYSDIVNTQQYIGIPVNLYWSLIRNKNLDVYVYTGGSVEKCLNNKYFLPDTGKETVLSNKVDGLQYSAAAGFGIEFIPVKRIGIYFDPDLRYYFDCGQPASIRTAQPLMFGFQCGLRFEL